MKTLLASWPGACYRSTAGLVQALLGGQAGAELGDHKARLQTVTPAVGHSLQEETCCPHFGPIYQSS